ncbi:hypothetical protein M427DRAFT_56011 [Gonapodya prolifera JEL478]|uniref:Uncharacterized protein n=1 Tax=Gonapodya prolifera (strain JEL478) TaxID=1344416 RepID=A0A139AH34_GONPJ|nr:hypothetical protein M427DRAFT_56011 [Gonapodya prolifera JEL478]|eukprot:KXS16116.1 hypothetical protein M427DRAFT_56011 [Gonapodya prolifera JEL478]
MDDTSRLLGKGGAKVDAPPVGLEGRIVVHTGLPSTVTKPSCPFKITLRFRRPRERARRHTTTPTTTAATTDTAATADPTITPRGVPGGAGSTPPPSSSSPSPLELAPPKPPLPPPMPVPLACPYTCSLTDVVRRWGVAELVASPRDELV